MSRKIIALAFLCLPLSYTQAQTQSYTQNIEGTSLQFDMLAIPAGTFDMGNNAGAEDEKPLHKVKIDAFWMGKHEVTWNIFEPFLY
ncbi:MAG: formylglycine-generating enzyme family protein, partial [Pedobacter sp.]